LIFTIIQYVSRIAEAKGSIEYGATVTIQPSPVLKSRENIGRGQSCLVFPLTVDVNVISNEEVGSGDGFK
jgi:hypothetical protein